LPENLFKSEFQKPLPHMLSLTFDFHFAVKGE
jgi:hypothetical protein